MRLIDADKLIKELHIAKDCADCRRYNGDCKGHLQWLCRRVENAPTIEVEPRWIPIEQDCPKMGKDVLISHNGVVSIDWLTQSEGVGYFFVSGVVVQDIDAWMPLPEPYRGVEE